MNQRMCVACKKRDDKSNFLRIEKVDGNVAVSNKKIDGSRGIYLCFDNECLKKAQKSKIISRTFNVDVSEDFYNQIKDLIERKTNVK